MSYTDLALRIVSQVLLFRVESVQVYLSEHVHLLAGTEER
jgi:hypothetical protein